MLGEQTRVLLIAGGPSHEYRILRNALTRDKTVELRCWLTSAGDDFPQDGNVSIDELPSDRTSPLTSSVVGTKRYCRKACLDFGR